MKSISELSETRLLDIAMVLYDIQEERNANPGLKTVRIEPFPFNEHLLARREIGGGNVTDEELKQARNVALDYLIDEDIIDDVEVDYEEKHDPAGFLFNETQFYDVTINQENFAGYSERVWQLAMPLVLESSRRQHKQKSDGGVTKTAELSFDDFTTPLVSVDGTTYELPAMYEGKAFHIVNYCLKHFPNKALDIDKLKAEFKAQGIPIVQRITNIKDELRKSIFGYSHELHVFVKVSPRAIMVQNKVQISEAQFKRITKISTKKLE